jgi:hypothetical protein
MALLSAESGDLQVKLWRGAQASPDYNPGCGGDSFENTWIAFSASICRRFSHSVTRPVDKEDNVAPAPTSAIPAMVLPDTR